MMVATRLIPSADRDAIVGDLFEEAAWRGLGGAARSWWIVRQCVTIALGLTIERGRAACSLSLVREVVSGVAVDSERVLHASARALFARIALFATGVLLLALSGEVLVRALLTAANLR
jgi:hypothetical protein